MSEATRKALAVVGQEDDAKTIGQLLERMQPQIALALPQAIGAERFTRLVLTEIRRTPALLECKPESVLASMMLCAQLGVEPGPLGHAYLVPFKGECTFVLGYKGMIELARRSERLAGIRAAVVYEGDGFEYEERQTGPYLRHRETDPATRGKVVCYYSLATIRNGTANVKRLWPDEIEAARKRSQLGRIGKGPWHTDYDAMALKTCVRRQAPWLPLSASFGVALDADDRGVIGLDDSGVALAEAESPREGMEE